MCIRSHCLAALIDCVVSTNCLEIAVVADKLSNQELKEKCAEVIAKENIRNCDEWVDFGCDNRELAKELLKLNP